MDRYFQIGDSVTKQIIEVFKQDLNDFGFIVGGGYGYDSIKYKGTEVIGDLDYICLIEDFSLLSSLLSNTGFIESLGFDITSVDKFYNKDIELFNKKFISVIRLSGKIKDIKTSINFSTFERLNSKFISGENIGLYKITHNKSGNILISKGTNGEDIVVSLISPEVSSWYNDDNRHYIFPDYAWIKNGDCINLGTLTDFIAKGVIAKDDGKKYTSNLQNLIISEMLKHVSPEIVRNKDWYKMFASCHLFSQEFKSTINQRVEYLYKKKIHGDDYEVILSHNSYVSVFTDIKFYKNSLLSSYSKEFHISKDGQILSNLFSNSSLKEADVLHIINAESKRLSNILSITSRGTKKVDAISLSSQNCLVLEGDNFSYKDVNNKTGDLIEELVNITNMESHQRNDTDNLDLIKYISFLRTDILSMMQIKSNPFLANFNDSNLYKNRKEVMNKLKLIK